MVKQLQQLQEDFAQIKAKYREYKDENKALKAKLASREELARQAQEWTRRHYEGQLALSNLQIEALQATLEKERTAK